MTDNYIVVLFKNKQKKKIIKSFKTEKKAKEFYERYLKSSNPIFEMLYENAEEVEYELSLMTNQNTYQLLLFKSDVYGRNEKVFVDDDSGFSIIEVKPFKLEEKLYDWQDNKRISFEEFLKTYCNKKEFKNIFSLNNKVVVQNDEKTNLFSLKNESEANRFIDALSNYFFKNKRADCIFIKDNSSAQRKYMLKLLEEQGFDKKILYRKSTTHPRLK